MMVLEHEAKDLLESVGIRVPKGIVIRPGTAAAKASARIKDYPVAVKAQIRSGGRGKAPRK